MLDEGQLIAEPSPAFRHNRIRSRIARHLEDFVQAHKLGVVTIENDFRLNTDTVRNPDIAFVNEQLSGMDVDRSPVDGVPHLAIEVISPGNSAQDMLKKVHQYLNAGCQAVWVFYPNLKVVEVHDSGGTREWRHLQLSRKRGSFRDMCILFRWSQSLMRTSGSELCIPHCYVCLSLRFGNCLQGFVAGFFRFKLLAALGGQVKIHAVLMNHVQQVGLGHVISQH